MSFEKGSLAVTVFDLTGFPEQEKALEAFRAKAAGKLDEATGEVQLGWVSGRDVLDRTLADQNTKYGNVLYLNLRMAQRKIPSQLFQAECKKEELEYMTMNKLNFVPGKVRRQIKKDIFEKRTPQMPPHIQSIPFVVERAANKLYLGTASPKLVTTFMSYFFLTFDKVQLTQFTIESAELNPIRFSGISAPESNPGRDFLTWLWYYGEEKNGTIHTDYGQFNIMVEGPLFFSHGDAESGSKETIVRKGCPLKSAEAKVALDVGKKLKKAKITIVQDKCVWSCSFDADKLSFTTLTLPDVENEGLDAEGMFIDRINQINIFAGIIQAYVDAFIKLATGPDWAKEEDLIIQWSAERYTEHTSVMEEKTEDEKILDATARQMIAERKAQRNPSVQQAVAKFQGKMQKLADKDGITVSISTPGREPVVVAEPRQAKLKNGKIV